PDGAKIAKVVWGKQQEDSNGYVLPGNFQNVQMMIKDSKKFRTTEGWGFAKFDGLHLKPFGSTALFQTTCINCHRLLVPENDFVFNIPTR
ncbi:MAG: cytochrome P460 family protein, partial [Chitinophagaceae bacterium]|nr:cytochrome P460 family protein [Chitinophagaceae bacterium]